MDDFNRTNRSSLNMSHNLTDVSPSGTLGLQEMPYLVVEAIIITVLNLFALIVFLQMRKFTYTNILYMALCLSDLMLGIFDVPLFVIFRTSPSWPLGSFMCYFFKVIAVAQFAVSNLIILVMALHRYLQLNRPLATNDELSWKRLAVQGLIWFGPYIYMTALALTSHFMDIVDTRICVFKLPFEYVLAHDIVLSVIPSLTAVLFNFYNIYSLYRKSRTLEALQNSSRKNSKVAKCPQTTEASANRNSIRNDSPSGKTSMTPQMISCNQKSYDLKRSRKAKRDFKAGLCMLFVVINIVGNQYFYNVAWPFVVKCPTCFSVTLFNWAAKNIFIFPIINPIILFVFNHKFKKHAINLIKDVCPLKHLSRV